MAKVNCEEGVSSLNKAATPLFNKSSEEDFIEERLGMWLNKE